MTTYHAVMLDETRCEFGVTVPEGVGDPYEWLAEQYPESTCVQLETPRQSRQREDTMYDLIRRGADFDDEGRPFFPHGDADEEDEEDEEDGSIDPDEMFRAMMGGTSTKG